MLDYHSRILKALRARNVDAGRRLKHDHLVSAADHLIDILDHQGILSNVMDEHSDKPPAHTTVP
jgi:hypothetical protein